VERGVLIALTLLVFFSSFALVRQFRLETSVLVPTNGGTYIEGSVGSLQPLIPWFVVQNDVNRDILSLVFSGLLRYDPQKKAIVDDLATLKVSSDAKTYTLTLKDGIFWHDTTKDKPHPVTADDVLFTFQTIQQPGFPNSLLQQNFRGVTIAKIDERTVTFTLSEPYSFFPSNLTLGLIPKKSFEGIPVTKLDQVLDFAFKPIGAGPYKVKTIVPTELSSEVTLERFERPFPPNYRLDRVVFRIFSDYATLLSDLRTLQGVRLVPRNKNGEALTPRHFVAREYTLPQYVALFFNLSRTKLQDGKLRLGLQLGTNKQAIVDDIQETHVIDTPLLEIDASDWRYQFDSEAAKGALFASRWSLPEKIRLQRLLEQRDASAQGELHVPAVVYLQPGQLLNLTGSFLPVKPGYSINGVRLVKSGAGWMATFNGETGTGSLKLGENLLKLMDEKGKPVDSAYVYRVKDATEFGRATAEQNLVDQFIRSKDPATPENQRITSEDLTLDQGFLRKRRPEDPVSVRTNEKGEPLTLTLLTSPSPVHNKRIAELVAAQWAKLGVKVTVDVPASMTDFQDHLLRRDYDVLLFGESLLDNLDAFPYWHSTGVQKLSSNSANLRGDAFNLSQYASFEADSLLEAIRKTADEKDRAEKLKSLQNIIKRDVPAVFLYSPTYIFAHRESILGVELGSLSLHSDRFLTLSRWYVRQERVFTQGKSWWSFIPWLEGLFMGGSDNKQ
jgi:ABC-type transport system substrate-binding protein